METGIVKGNAAGSEPAIFRGIYQSIIRSPYEPICIDKCSLLLNDACDPRYYSDIDKLFNIMYSNVWNTKNYLRQCVTMQLHVY